jgi:hypothetical protein
MKTDHAPAVAVKQKRPQRGLVPTAPKLSDSEREKIMQGANERPAKIDLSVPATKPAEPAEPAQQPVAKAPAVVPEAPAVAAEASDPNALPAGPWDQADPNGKDIPFLLRLPPPLHAKMTFLSAHLVPHKAKHRMSIDILSARFDELIRQYYARTSTNK